MRILALGGSGGMGRFAVRAIVDLPDVQNVTVADLNEPKAQAFCDELGEKAIGIALDVSNEEQLLAAMSKAEVVLNMVGPFFRFGPPILKAAIKSGCHYLDICDDWEPTLEMLKLDALAKEADISALIGIGASPGISNMLALVALKELDTVDKIYTGWNMAGAKPAKESSQSGPNAAMEHAIEQLTGKVQIFKAGQYQMARPLEQVTLAYPGQGDCVANIFGHPEAVTFPHHYPQLQESINLAHGISPQDRRVIQFIRWFIETGLLSKKAAARLLHWLENNISDESIRKPGNSILPPIYGLAQGTRQGQPGSVGVALAAGNSEANIGMGAVTGFPLACALQMLLEGKLLKRGVFAPESALDPQIFFELLKGILVKNFKTPSDGKPLLKINRSWDA